MKRKGFTLVELLVVIAIIALLMGILMPALARVRQLAFRMTCGTNLSGIGKAMLLYSNDYQDELPRAGGRNTTWGPVLDWTGGGTGGGSRIAAFGPDTGGTASISSCFYLLVKYTEVTPKSFICKGDAGTTEFKPLDPTMTPPAPAGFELIEGWDFGPPSTAYKSCSYSYHMPFGLYALTVSSEPGFAVAADRNPFIESPAGTARDPATFVPEVPPYGGTSSDLAKNGNCNAHQLDGQNVMFLDTHVTFEKRAYCSIEDDNIYLVAPTALKGDAKGAIPVPPAVSILSRKDSVLVHDPASMGSTTPARATRGS